ncbi:probable plastid-lipid-associated protein 4, chloroplastic isoform X2 [Zingiber officinale]|uniref:probable plastid-lipid-associated protein 4, chloroplastic isoform X2 n=1 Tax=Zingiber officinale TaxID=94328 RepID=UPI001C4AA6F4|nr:probable plastid-lipid-associated protein 4, chloroplastic isoform X2 [Zingiber officinale]
MALTSLPLAPPSAYVPSPRSLCLPHQQLPSPLSSRRFKETGVAAPLEFSSAASLRWRTGVSFFPSFIKKKARSREEIKEELLAEIAPIDRGAEATDEDKERIDQRPKFLRPNGKIYQAINVDTLRAQNMETWPYFNQVTANLIPLNARRVKAQWDTFKILGLIPIKAPGTNRGELDITYLDEEIRISRGYKGNLFILKMVDRSYRVPL